MGYHVNLFHHVCPNLKYVGAVFNLTGLSMRRTDILLPFISIMTTQKYNKNIPYFPYIRV